MRAPILVVIFDFLVGSLLLFVVAPDAGYRAAPKPSGGEFVSTSEFSPAAVAAHYESAGAEWDALWTAQQLATATAKNEKLIADLGSAEGQLTDTGKALTATITQLEEEKKTARERAQEIADQKARLEEERLKRANLDKLFEAAQQEKQVAQRLLAETREKEADLAEKLKRSEITAEQHRLLSAEMKKERDAANQQALTATAQAAQLNTEIASLSKSIAVLTGTVVQTNTDLKNTFFAASAETQAAVRENTAALTTLTAATTAQNQQLQLDIGKLDKAVAALPEQMRQEIAPLQEMQANLTRQSDLLVQSTAQLSSVLSAEEVQNLQIQFRDLGAAQAALQKDLQAAADTASAALGGDTVKNIEAQITKLSDQQSNLGSSIEQIQARRQGPHKAVVGARFEVSISMEEEDNFDPNDRLSAKTYPLLFMAGNRRYLAAHKSSLKLDWDELVADGDLIALSVTYGRPPGDNRWSSPSGGHLLALAQEPRIILLEAVHPNASKVVALPLVGRDKIAAQGLSDVRIVKSSLGASIFSVEASVNFSRPGYLTVRRPAISFRDDLPVVGTKDLQPDIGDYLVTTDGALIGVMISDRDAYILDESDVTNIALRLPISDHAEFVKQAKALHSRTR